MTRSSSARRSSSATTSVCAWSPRASRTPRRGGCFGRSAATSYRATTCPARCRRPRSPTGCTNEASRSTRNQRHSPPDACRMHTEYAYCVSMENVRLSRRRGRALARGMAACVVVAAMASAGYAAYGAGIRPPGGPSRPVATPPPRGVAPTGTGDVSHLDPALRHAFAVARHDAAAQGIEMSITSGWRSHAEQTTLFAAAVRKYGSAVGASHWVLPPGHSAHERGAAIDVGPAEGAAWLDAHGVHYGLCRRCQNEPWHFELLAPALGQSCPTLEPYAHA